MSRDDKETSCKHVHYTTKQICLSKVKHYRSMSCTMFMVCYSTFNVS